MSIEKKEEEKKQINATSASKNFGVLQQIQCYLANENNKRILLENIFIFPY